MLVAETIITGYWSKFGIFVNLVVVRDQQDLLDDSSLHLTLNCDFCVNHILKKTEFREIKSSFITGI